MADHPTWVWCADCGHRSHFEFYTPRKVICEDCGQIVGEATEEVHDEIAAIKTYYQVVVNAETDEVLSSVEWKNDRVEIREPTSTK